ncbi:MAG: dienelactone hydrolase family protein [Acidimicrobiales bacterium]
MAEVVFFHHAQGLTTGCRALAGRFAAAGHSVHTPDLYEGRTFSELPAGIAYAEEVGFEEILERGRMATEGLPAQAVYMGVSLGVLPAQLLAQTRPGARAAVLVSAAVPPTEFGGVWPAGVPLQIHMMDADPLVADEGDLAVAEDMAATLDPAELFRYPGDGHLFVDESLTEYDAAATDLVVERVLGLLAGAAEPGRK